MADENGNSNLPALQRLLEERTKSLFRVGNKLKEALRQVDELATQRDAAFKARDEATALADKARKDYDTSGLAADVERLRGELRTRDHRAVFDRLAAERGAPADALEPLYRLSGYKAEQDQPDDAAIAKVFDGLKTGAGTGRLFGEPAPTTPATPPPGSGQGAREAGGKWRVTTAQMADGAWAMANNARIQQASKDGTLELVQV